MVLTPEYTKTLNFKKELKKPDECSLALFFEKIKEAIRSTDDGEKALRSMEYFHAGGNLKMIRSGSRETFYADIQPGGCEGILVCFYLLAGRNKGHCSLYWICENPGRR